MASKRSFNQGLVESNKAAPGFREMFGLDPEEEEDDGSVVAAEPARKPVPAKAPVTEEPGYDPWARENLLGRIKDYVGKGVDKVTQAYDRASPEKMRGKAKPGVPYNEVGGYGALREGVNSALKWRDEMDASIKSKWDRDAVNWQREKQGLPPLPEPVSGRYAGPASEVATPFVAAPKDKPKGKGTGSTAGGGKGGGSSSSKPTGGEMTDAALTMQVADVAEQGEEGALPKAEQEAYDNLKRKIAAHKTGLDLSPLMALSDTWFGGNQAASYKAPISEDERDLKLAGVELEEGKRGTELGIKNADRIANFRKALLKYKTDLNKDASTERRHRERLAAIRQGRAGGKTVKPGLTENQFVSLKAKANPRNFEKVVIKHTPKGRAPDVAEAIAFIDAMALDLQEQGLSERAAADAAHNRFSQTGYGKAQGIGENTPNEGWFDKINPFDDDEEEEEDD